MVHYNLLFSLFVFSLFFSSAQAQDTTVVVHEKRYENGQLKESGWYEKVSFRKIVTTRPAKTWKVYYENGQLLETGTYKNGEKEGEWQSFHENGQLKRTARYRGGEIEGEYRTYFDNGQLAIVCFFKGDGIEGEYKSYYDNGQLARIGNYKQHEKEGIWKYYHANGKLSEKGVFEKNDEIGEWQQYDTLGTLMEITTYESEEIIKDYVYAAIIKTYYPSRKLKCKTRAAPTIKSRQVCYYEAGGKEAEGFIDEENIFVKVGHWNHYYKNGKYQSRGAYVEGKRDGLWFVYHESGRSSHKFIYEKGLLKKAQVLDKDRRGNLLEVGTFVNGTGTIHYYNERRKLVHVDYYLDGIYQKREVRQ